MVDTYNLSANKGAQTAAQIAALDIALFLAVGDSLDLPTQYAVQSGDLTGDFATLPAGYLPVGIMEKKSGVALENAITVTATEGYGYQEPTRNIRKSRQITLDFTMIQTGMIQLGAYWGVDFSAVTADETTGEVNLPIPESALDLEYRAILVGKDGPAGAEIYSIWDGPRATINKTGKIQMSDDGVQTYPVTFEFLFDSTYGYALRPNYCGLGMLNGGATIMGFNPVSEVQLITITGSPSAGTFTLTFGGQTTSGLAYTATATTIQTALQGLSSIGSGNALVTGSAGGPWTVTFAGTMADTAEALITADGSGLTGGSVTVSEVTAGHA